MSSKRTRRSTAGIDERAFPYDVTGTQKPYYKAMLGIKDKHRASHGQYLESTEPMSRRKQVFQSYTFKRKPNSVRPHSAPAYKTDLGGTLKEFTLTAGNNRKEQPKPKMRPNSAHFLSSSSRYPNRKEVDLDSFPSPRPQRPKGGSTHTFVHPTPPTDNMHILTSHEKMFYTRHFEKLAVKNAESLKYKLDKSYNEEVRQFDNVSKTIHAPSDELITDYRLGHKKKAFPPRVVEHKKTGLQRGRGVGQRSSNGVARNALGGFYC